MKIAYAVITAFVMGYHLGFLHGSMGQQQQPLMDQQYPIIRKAAINAEKLELRVTQSVCGRK